MLNNDLISRPALLAAYDAAHKGPPGGARKLIEEAPGVGAAPVAHGRWTDRGSLSCRCSCCGSKSNAEYNYCPHCGAKMDAPTCGPDHCEIGGD